MRIDTSWANSQAERGEDKMTTKRVLGTSSPMAPAEVDKRHRTDLKNGNKSLSKIWSHPSLYS